LARGNQDRRILEEIVKCGRDAPGAERVKDDAARLERLVRMSLVEKMSSGMRRVEERLELETEELDLVLGGRAPHHGPDIGAAILRGFLVGPGIGVASHSRPRERSPQ
jgi:hypothetical protein